eukprot:Skav221240  [mRNA]  locus=scaffold1045:84449:95403:+ [translate_table: standard]
MSWQKQSAPFTVRVLSHCIVVELNGILFWVTQCEATEITRNRVRYPAAGLQGVSVHGSRLEEASVPRIEGPARLKVRIFVGDYLVRYQCAVTLQAAPPRTLSLEKMVLNPTRQERGTYASPRPLQSQLMPFNDDQASAVRSLSQRVELIHGPPGTGKSTTIFHVLSSRMPLGSASVVTCVTNQAIDAVAQKLAITHEARYTLDNLCKRDALVVASRRWLVLVGVILGHRDAAEVSMQWAFNLLDKVLKAVEALQSSRQQRLWRPHSRSRFTRIDIERLPSVQRYRQELERENLRRRREFMPEETYDPVKFYINRLNSVKEKMAWVVVRSKALRLRPRVWSFRVLPPWNVEDFRQRLKKCHAKAQNALRVARDTAPVRVDFPTRLSMCILDEAAATAETYVPLVIRRLDWGAPHGWGTARSGSVKTGSSKGDQLRSDISCEMGSLRLHGSALRWIDIRHGETEVGTSKINCKEVKEIVATLQADSTFAREHVMIIALYKPQAALLEDTLRKFFPQRLDSGSIKAGSNHHGSIGFASNPRRLCVALSRAQKTLSVFGNSETYEQLSRGASRVGRAQPITGRQSRPNWQQVVDYFRRQRVLQSSSQVISSSVADFVDGRAREMVAARAGSAGHVAALEAGVDGVTITGLAGDLTTQCYQ